MTPRRTPERTAGWTVFDRRMSYATRGCKWWFSDADLRDAARLIETGDARYGSARLPDGPDPGRESYERDEMGRTKR